MPKVGFIHTHVQNPIRANRPIVIEGLSNAISEHTSGLKKVSTDFEIFAQELQEYVKLHADYINAEVDVVAERINLNSNKICELLEIKTSDLKLKVMKEIKDLKEIVKNAEQASQKKLETMDLWLAESQEESKKYINMYREDILNQEQRMKDLLRRWLGFAWISFSVVAILSALFF